MKYAAFCDGLVLGIGETEMLACADAEENGVDNETCLDACEISDAAAEYIRLGGDCRALTFATLKNGEMRIIIDADENITE